MFTILPQFLNINLTGQFYPVSNPDNYTTSGNLYLTGLNLGNRLYQTGVDLVSLINASNAGVSSINSLSGVLNVIGTGEITVHNNGQYLIISGNSGDYATKYFLTATGATLYNLLNSYTGYQNTNPSGFITSGQTGQFYPMSNPNNFSTSGNLQSTGQNLYNYTIGLSGLLSGNILSTGQQAWNTANNNAINLSGNLQSTGSTLSNNINSLSGFVGNIQRVSAINVTGFGNQTGIINVSGAGNILVSTGSGNFIYVSGINLITTSQTGQFYPASNPQGYATSGNLQSTGQNLYSYITNTSGNLSTRLYQTGVDIITLINASAGGVSSLNNASGIISLTGAGNVTVISGGVGLIYVSGDTGIYSSFYQNSNPNNYATSGNIQTTGQAAWNAAHNNAVNLSGNLTQTGVNLGSKIDFLSGFVRNTSISVTGFSPAFTGLIGVSGKGNVTVFTGVNNTIIFSGTHNDAINLSGILTTTGQTLYNYITSTSGNLSARLYQTGVDLINLINASAGGVSSLNNASGILSITGKGNVTVISGGVGLIYISGDTGAYSSFYQQSNSNNYCTSGNLQSTGISLQSQINSLNNATGYINTNPSGFITQNNADNRFVHLTGNENINGLKVFSGAIFSGYFSGYSLTGHNIKAINRIVVPMISSSDGDDAINLIDRTLEDTSPDSSLDWANKRLLRGNSEGDIITIDWYNRILSGTWNVLGGIRTSGAALITGLSTGYFISTSQTGQFYPASNPQQYITSGNVSTISGILSDKIYSTGQTLNNKINTLSGYIHSSGSNIVYTTGDQTIGGDKIFSPDSYFIVYDSAPGINVIDVGTDDHFVLRSNTDSNDSVDVSNRKLIGSWNINNVSGYVTTGFLQTGIIGQNFIKSNKINFKQTGLYNLYTVPNNHFFMIDEMEILTSNLSSAGDAPYIKFGNLINDQEYQTATQTTSNSQYSRHIFANPQDAVTGGSSLIFTIATGSTAIMHSGYGIIKGYLIQDN